MSFDRELKGRLDPLPGAWTEWLAKLPDLQERVSAAQAVHAAATDVAERAVDTLKAQPHNLPAVATELQRAIHGWVQAVALLSPTPAEHRPHALEDPLDSLPYKPVLTETERDSLEQLFRPDDCIAGIPVLSLRSAILGTPHTLAPAVRLNHWSARFVDAATQLAKAMPRSGAPPQRSVKEPSTFPAT